MVYSVRHTVSLNRDEREVTAMTKNSLVSAIGVIVAVSILVTGLLIARHMWRKFAAIQTMTEFHRSAGSYAYTLVGGNATDPAKAAYTNLTPSGLTNGAPFLTLFIARDDAERWLIGASGVFRSVFSPVSPHGDVICFSQRWFTDAGHFWMYGSTYSAPHVWSLVGENLTRRACNDGQISWYYQKLLSTLNDEEYEKERAYRASEGLPALPNRR